MQVLGFPCNQFAGQEPGTDEEILEFATSKFDVDFPMFSKIEVNGDGTCELYRMLKEAQPGDGDRPLKVEGVADQRHLDKVLRSGGYTMVEGSGGPDDLRVVQLAESVPSRRDGR